ncbi:MAG: phosphoglycerate dehydrogenase [Gammaproteobacteria bacterium]|nr:phosphoglycerate dehydrogenase [Gammaproteobacteria bacterium]
MLKIRTINSIAVAGLERFPRDRYEVASELSNPDAILLRSHDLHDETIPASVLAVARAGAGVNNIPVQALSERGVVVFNTPGANANAVKELVVAGMLLAARNIPQALEFTAGLDGDDNAMHVAVEAGKKRFVGTELEGKTLGVIGLGAIGVRVANVAIGLGMRVVGFDPAMSVERALQLSTQVRIARSVGEVLVRADFVSLHVPLVEATRGFIDETRLAAMKPDACLLNFSRDGIVDDKALFARLNGGGLRAYVCDFPGSMLQAHPRVIALPHLGASTAEAEQNCAVMAAEQLRDFLEHGNIANSVNYPAVSMPRSDGYRLAIANQNVPNMLGQISTCLAQADLNILDMLNRSRGEAAYTLTDVDPRPDDAVLEALRAIRGVRSVRLVTA